MYTLIRHALKENSALGAYSVKLTLTTSDPELFPAKAFVYQAETPADPDTRGWFTAVASPAQIEEYPEDAPELQEGLLQPYYRLSTIQFVGRSAAQLEAAVAEVVTELRMLSHDLTAINSLLDSGYYTEETLTIV